MARLDVMDMDRYWRLITIVPLDKRVSILKTADKGMTRARKQYLDRPNAPEYIGRAYAGRKRATPGFP